MRRIGSTIIASFLLLGQTLAQTDTISVKNWHRNYSKQQQGTNSDKALSYLKEQTGIKPEKIIIAVLDSGIDLNSEEVRPALWTNKKEWLTGIKGKDDDRNGYIDDMYGWNFLGSADGKLELTSVGTQEFREFQRLHKQYKDYPKDSQDKGYLYYRRMRREAHIDSYFKLRDLERRKQQSFNRIDSTLRREPQLDVSKLTIRQFMHLPNQNKVLEEEVEIIISNIMRADTSSLWTKVKARQTARLELIESRLKSIEDEVDKRTLLGDDMTKGGDRYYGNNKLNSQGLEHGNFVASVISGAGLINHEVRGIYPEAKLMILRIVPDKGDEYDKDISSAIRYAVDNGAKIINLSFGKYTSPQPNLVQEAFDYALKNDVLLVHASGNDNKDLNKTAYYPSGLMNKNAAYPNYIRVGATDALGARAKFSNYGKYVDLYASGVQIWGTMKGQKQNAVNGTSISAPIVSGIAGILRAYFPELKAKDIKEILVKSARPLKGEKTPRAGCVDALKAVQIAKELMAKKKGLDWAKIEQASAQHLDPYVKKYFVYPHWLEDKQHFYYQTTNSQGERRLYLCDAKTGRKEVLISNMQDFAKQYKQLTGEKINPNQLNYYGVTFSDEQFQRFYFKVNGKFFDYDRAKAQLSLHKNNGRSTHSSPIKKGGKSKEANYDILTKGYNLFIQQKQTKDIKQITFDGKEGVSYAYHHRTKLSRKNARGQWWGDKYVVILRDDSQVGEMSVIDWLADRPKTKTFKMPLAGDKNCRKYKLFCYDTKSQKAQNIEEEDIDYKLLKDENKIYYTRRSRIGSKVELFLIDLNKGFKPQLLITEEIKPHINLSLFNYKLIRGGEQIIWWSERTGRGNYYLYNKDGRLIRRLTKGKTIVAGKIISLDEKKGTMIFAAYGAEQGHNPYYRHYYKTKLKGGRQILLTPENAQHELELSPSKEYFVDSYSRMDMPTHWKVGRVDKPKKAKVFAKVNRNVLERVGWQAPKLVRLKAKDNKTELYGVLYTPYNYDKNKAYPLITNVYPGPQTDLVPRKFAIDDNGNQTLANMGCFVLNIASRGSSPLRGKDFYCYGYGNLRDYPLEDNKYCIEQLAKTYPIDLNRIGIYGHSGGAFQTVAAMCTYPAFYKVGFAASGNHDNNIYINWWGEVFHGSTPIPTNIELAKNLQGKLMLAVGDMDKNVPMGNTVRMANALIKAGKAFDYFLFPSARHDLDSPYYQNLIRYYFGKNLLGLKLNDIDIINHR